MPFRSAFWKAASLTNWRQTSSRALHISIFYSLCLRPVDSNIGVYECRQNRPTSNHPKLTSKRNARYTYVVRQLMQTLRTYQFRRSRIHFDGFSAGIGRRVSQICCLYSQIPAGRKTFKMAVKKSFAIFFVYSLDFYVFTTGAFPCALTKAKSCSFLCQAF